MINLIRALYVYVYVNIRLVFIRECGNNTYTPIENIGTVENVFLNVLTLTAPLYVEPVVSKSKTPMECSKIPLPVDLILTPRFCLFILFAL